MTIALPSDTTIGTTLEEQKNSGQCQKHPGQILDTLFKGNICQRSVNVKNGIQQ